MGRPLKKKSFKEVEELIVKKVKAVPVNESLDGTNEIITKDINEARELEKAGYKITEVRSPFGKRPHKLYVLKK